MMQPITHLTEEFLPWLAYVIQAPQTTKGAFKLVGIRKTAPKSFEEQRIVVLVMDENGVPMPNIPVVFGYSTGPQPAPFVEWNAPRPPFRALVVPTQGSGQIDQIQGSSVNEGEPGGITVYIGLPDIASDAVGGCGMLQDHTGLHLTFQRQLAGVVPVSERVSNIEARLAVIEEIVFGGK